MKHVTFIKRAFIGVTSFLLLLGVTQSASAGSSRLDYGLGSANFNHLLAEDGFGWDCDVITTESSPCTIGEEASTIKHNGERKRGISVGSPHAKIRLTRDLVSPIEDTNLTFEYRVVQNGSGNEESFVSVFGTLESSTEKMKLWEATLDETTSWQAVSVDASEYTNTDSITSLGFTINNGGDSNAQVLIRNVRLKSKYLTGGAAIRLKNQAGELVTPDRVIVKRGRTSEKLLSLDNDGTGWSTYFSYEIPAGKNQLRFYVHYNGERYFFDKRIRRDYFYSSGYQIVSGRKQLEKVSYSD